MQAVLAQERRRAFASASFIRRSLRESVRTEGQNFGESPWAKLLESDPDEQWRRKQFICEGLIFF